MAELVGCSDGEASEGASVGGWDAGVAGAVSGDGVSGWGVVTGSVSPTEVSWFGVV